MPEEREPTAFETALYEATAKGKQYDPNLVDRLFKQSVQQQTNAFLAMKAVPGYPKYKLSLAENITEIIQLLQQNSGGSTSN